MNARGKTNAENGVKSHLGVRNGPAAKRDVLRVLMTSNLIKQSSRGRVPNSNPQQSSRGCVTKSNPQQSSKVCVTKSNPQTILKGVCN